MTDYSAQIAAALPSDEPLIYTALGNLPEGALQYTHSWDVTVDAIVFREQWTLDGVEVKSNAHAYAINSLTAGAIGEL